MANVASAGYLVFELFHTPSIGCTDQLETAYVFSEQSDFFLETLLSWARGPTDGNARGGGGRRRDGHRNPERGRREGGRQNGPGVHHLDVIVIGACYRDKRRSAALIVLIVRLERYVGMYVSSSSSSIINPEVK